MTELPLEGGELGVSVLRGYIERIERLSEEKSGISADISEIFKQAESKGFDKKAMREVIKLRKMERDARRELENHVDAYKLSLGLED